MVSTRSLQEVNRLHHLYRPDLTPYTVSSELAVKRKHKLSGTCMLPNSTMQSNGSLKLLKTPKSTQHGTLPTTSRNTLAPVPQSVANSGMCKGRSQGFAQSPHSHGHLYPGLTRLARSHGHLNPVSIRIETGLKQD